MTDTVPRRRRALRRLRVVPAAASVWVTTGVLVHHPDGAARACVALWACTVVVVAVMVLRVRAGRTGAAPVILALS
ncbi:MAG: hypothetical protein J0H70_14665, partial [Microbacterium chocolatum]|nr:hypothetical protein [Microbacterium chocolatum]